MTREPTPVSEPTLVGLGHATRNRSVASFFEGNPFDVAPARPEELRASAFFELFDAAPRGSLRGGR